MVLINYCIVHTNIYDGNTHVSVKECLEREIGNGINITVIFVVSNHTDWQNRPETAHEISSKFLIVHIVCKILKCAE